MSTSSTTQTEPPKQDEPAKQSKSSGGIMYKLPPTMVRNLKDPRKWKNWFRTMVVIFVCMVYLVVQDTLDVLGQAGFFHLIVSILMPPSMPLATFIFAMLTIVVGMCLGWAWGVAAMSAALRARSTTLLASQYTTAQSSLVGGVAPDAQFQSFIFHGDFLDTRSTVVFAVFFFVGIFALAALRAVAPKLTLTSIFGTIVLIILCTYGPLFPSAQFTLATQFLIPTGFYVATAIAACILIFPQTVNHMVTDGYVKGFLQPGNGIIALQGQVLQTDPTDPKAWAELAEKVKQLRTVASETLVALDGQLGMLELEVSRGRISARDLKTLMGKSRTLIGRMVGVSSFQLLVARQQQSAIPSGAVDGNDDEKSHLGGESRHHHVREWRYQQFMKQKEAERGHRLVDLLPVLDSTSERLRRACTAGLADFTGFLDYTNHHRWAKKKIYPEGETAQSGLDKRQANLHELRDALKAYRQSEHLKVLEKFKDLFDEETGDYRKDHPSLHAIERGRPTLSMRQLFLCFVFSTNLTSYAMALSDFLDTALEIEARSNKNRFQWPTAFNKIGKVALSRENDNLNPIELGSDEREYHSHDADHSSTSSDDDSLEKPSGKAQRKQERAAKRTKLYRPDLDALPPRNALQKFTRKLSVAWNWFSSPEGLFALKAALVSIALWIPSVVESSAWFAYSNRSIWAQIMAVTGLAVFSGDLVLGFLVRFIGTLAGLVLGMLAWYVGNGNGHNPYGTTAALMVFIAPVVFWRISVAKPADAAFPMMMGVTTALIVGYSWVDSHLALLANSGIGVDVAWKRALLVLIGFAAAFIISLFPKPTSARKIVRLRAAKIVDALADLYMDELKGFLIEAKEADHRVDENRMEERAGAYRTRVLGVVGRLGAVEPQLASAGFEPSLRGPWPKDRYHELFGIIRELTGVLALLSNAWTRTEPRYAKAITNTPFFDPPMVADTLALFSLISSSLRNGQPMPVCIPLMERMAGLSIHTAQDQLELYNVRLNWKTLQNEQTAVYATTIVALSNTSAILDRLHDVVRQLVGTRSFDLFEEHAEERANRDIAVFGQA